MSADTTFDFEKHITKVDLPETSTGTATVSYDYKGVRGAVLILLDGFDIYGSVNVRRTIPADGNFNTPAGDFVGICLDRQASAQFNQCFGTLVKDKFREDRERALYNGELFLEQRQNEHHSLFH